MFQDFIEILILSAIQGISEFLPISSSAHLILVSNLYDLKTSSLLIDISLHLGSLLAIIFFFRKDLFNLKNNQKLLSLIIVGSIPLIIFGYILHTTELIHLLRNIKVIAWTTLFFGIILYFADIACNKIDRRSGQVGQTSFVSVVQADPKCCALKNDVSRSSLFRFPCD